MSSYIDHNALQCDDWGVHHEEDRLYVSQFMPSESRTLALGQSTDGDYVHIYIIATPPSPELVVARYNMDMELLDHRKNGFLMAAAFPAMASITPGTLDPKLRTFLLSRNLLSQDDEVTYVASLHHPVLEDLRLPLPF